MSVICKEIDHLSRRERATANRLAARIERAIVGKLRERAAVLNGAAEAL